MASNYLFTFQPTFTQGFVLGQLSILALLTLVLKYLFWDSRPEPQPVSLPPRTERTALATVEKVASTEEESLEWFNVLLLSLVQSYREQFREFLSGDEATELVRRKLQDRLNQARPHNFTDPIRVHSVELGDSAPKLSGAKLNPPEVGTAKSPTISFSMSYHDSVSISLSTSILLHYPRPYFARLPVSVTLSMSRLICNLLLVLPDPSLKAQSVTLTLPPDFTLDLQTNSLMGSRAKLADVPKIHEMIENQIRHFILQRGTWTVILPSIVSTVHVSDKDRDGVP